MTDSLDAHRAKLARLTGPARTRTLLELGQKLADLYWRQGPGQPAGLPYLSEAIAAIGEAYGYFAADDAWRGQVASQLGWLHGVRFLAHAGPEPDRDAGLALLEEALAFPQLSPVLQDMSRIALGQLYLARATRVLQSPQVAAMLIGPGLPPQALADAERAAGLFRTVLARPSAGADAVEAVKASLAVAEAFRDAMASVRGGAAGFNFGGMIQAMQAMQDLQRLQNSRSGRGGAFPAMPSLFDADAMSRLDPLDRPVAVVDAPPPAGPPPAPTPQPAPIVPDPAALRRELHALVAADRNVFAALAAALGPDGRDLAVDAVDDMVALAVATTAGPGGDDTDQLLLAVALYLRGRLDADGWALEPGGDFELAGAALARADRTLRATTAEAAPVLNRLAALLDRARPADRFRSQQSPPPQPARTAGPRTGAAPFTDDPWMGTAIVANPRGDRPVASSDAVLLLRAFYPAARLLGAGAAQATPARPETVVAALHTPLLQLSCAVSPAGALKLAEDTELPPERIRTARTAGGLAVLPPTGVGLTALGDALLTAGFRGVVTWKRVVPSRIAALMLFVLHQSLAGDRLDPAAAVAHVRDWMRDPRRPKPTRCPDEYAPTLARRELVDEAYWGALVYRDC
ncbi:hypothetical protein COUCH_35945 [Couchioplanes caeruleus]|uniref:hypothetical protein n=1 Tax=Couchioplanes caeruleus TaxID=56438 RepID=UPI0020C13B72|nr:hypothetical protein [Couchioplanes caeruleus]UQU64293.1 hypothetical protein COUCH_35945 [Couchioplanes caeruleus]